MKFCSVCKNMYYVTMGDAPGASPEEATTKVLIHKCRNCGNEEKNTESTISEKTQARYYYLKYPIPIRKSSQKSSMSKRTLFNFPQGSWTNFFEVLFWSEISLVETVKTT